MSTLELHEAAELLKISDSTLLRQARVGIVPGTKIGRKWVFIRDDLLATIRQKYKTPCSIDAQTLRTGGSDSSLTEEKSGSRLAQQIARKRKNLKPRLAIVHGGKLASEKSQ